MWRISVASLHEVVYKGMPTKTNHELREINKQHINVAKITLIQQCTILHLVCLCRGILYTHLSKPFSPIKEVPIYQNQSECPTLRYISAKQNEEPHVWSYATGEHGRQHTANYNLFLSATESEGNIQNISKKKLSLLKNVWQN